MNVLIVAATHKEIKPLLEFYSIEQNEGFIKSEKPEVPSFLITGIGSVPFSYYLAKVLSHHTFDLAINFGVCGAFKESLLVGDTCKVTRDCLADVGAEDGEDFLPLSKLNFPNDSLGWLYASGFLKIDLPEVSAITVNTVTGNGISKNKYQSLYNADVETMEGAAFFYCCIKENTPCVQIRTVSNYIGKREDAKWDITLAIEELNKVAISVIQKL